LDCKNVQDLLSAYSDRELDLVKSLDVENHLEECISCADKTKAYTALNNLTRTPSLYYNAPARLRERISASLEKEDAQIKRSRINFRWIGYAASIVFAFFLGFMSQQFKPSSSAEDAFNQEIVSSHLRSLMPDHLTDVASTDQHTVKPWFNGKVEYSPVVKDFASQGFPLIGGRLDSINLKRVPVLVYARHKHFINLYSWPSSDKTTGVHVSTLHGYHIAGWVSAGTAYYAVSDLNVSELQDFVKLFQTQS